MYMSGMSNESNGTLEKSAKQRIAPHQRLRKYSARLARYKKHHKKLFAGFSIFTAILLFFFLLQPTIGVTFTNKRADLLSTSASLSQAINRLPSPEGITFEQPNGDTRSIVNRSAEQQQIVSEAAENLSIGRHYQVFAWGHFGSSPRAVNQLRQNIRTLNQQVSDNLPDYIAALEALLLFFEYSPSTDFFEYDPASSDTQQRVKRLNDGIETTIESLQAIDSALAQSLLVPLEQAQDLTGALVQSNDVTQFAEDFANLQSEARQMLINYYAETYPEVRTSISSLNRSLNKAL